MKPALIASVAALAAAVGAGLYITDLPAYLSSDPATCNRCRVMHAAYEGWYHGAHRPRATCVDCHAPRAPVAKYLYKGYAGTRDAIFYTLDIVPAALRAGPLARAIVQVNCLRCRGEAVSDVGDGQPGAGRTCVACHRSVAHAQRGLSLLPNEDTGR